MREKAKTTDRSIKEALNKQKNKQRDLERQLSLRQS